MTAPYHEYDRCGMSLGRPKAGHSCNNRLVIMVLLREARIAAGLSYRELGARLGFSHVSVINYEKGKALPTVELALKWAEACARGVEG